MFVIENCGPPGLESSESKSTQYDRPTTWLKSNTTTIRNLAVMNVSR